MEWTVEFYRDVYHREPAAVFIDSLSVGTRAKGVRLLNLLAEYGVLLKEPYTKQVRGKIRELRVTDQKGAIRVLYFGFAGRRLILLHGFIKKTDKTPKRDIEVAEKRMKNFIERYGDKQ
jgi:phage-related protein